MTAATAVAGCCIWRSSVRMPPPSAWSRVRGHLLSFVFISTPFMVAGGIGMMLSNLLRAHGRGRQSMWVLLAGTATVALLDPLVIFVFQGGLQGVAWPAPWDAWPPCCWAAGWCSDATGWCAGRPVESCGRRWPRSAGSPRPPP